VPQPPQRSYGARLYSVVVPESVFTTSIVSPLTLTRQISLTE